MKALPQGITEKEFKLTNEYFEAIDAPDVQRGELSSSLSVNRTDDFFELNFHTEGCLLYTSPATVKLKGIDGGPHKRRNMWFNSMIREEPYPGLNCRRRIQRW